LIVDWVTCLASHVKTALIPCATSLAGSVKPKILFLGLRDQKCIQMDSRHNRNFHFPNF
jgi:hypothetical protein